MTAEGQAHAFAAMLLLGMALGVVYDAGMLLRRAARAGRLATAAADLAFGLICAAGMTAAALHLRIRADRWFVFAGTAAGLALQQATAGLLLRGLMRFVRKKRGKGRKKVRKMGIDG